MTDAATLAFAYGHCQALLRDHDKDRYLADLFIPAAARPHVAALHAFSLEIARVRDVAREPMAGELRHQWWRDALAGDALGDADAHPVAAALRDTVHRCALQREPLLALIEARGFDLYDDPMPDLAALEAYCRDTSSSLFALAARIVTGEAAFPPDAVDHAGLAYAFAGLIRALPLHAARGQVFLPDDMLTRHGLSRDDVVSMRSSPRLVIAIREWRAKALRHFDIARTAIAALPDAAGPAFRPLALVPLHLRLVMRADYDPFHMEELPQWRRQWALWRGL